MVDVALLTEAPDVAEGEAELETKDVSVTVWREDVAWVSSLSSAGAEVGTVWLSVEEDVEVAEVSVLLEEVEELVEVVEEELVVLEELVVSVPEEVLAPLLVSVPFRSEDKPVCHWMRGMYRYLP